MTVYIVQVNILASVSPAHHMIHCAGVLNAQLAGHAANLPGWVQVSIAKRTMLWVDPLR